MGFFDTPPADWKVPEGAWASDHNPWSGNEAYVFAHQYEIGRAVATTAREIRAASPDHEVLDDAKRILRHLKASREALLKSWNPTGKLN